MRSRNQDAQLAERALRLGWDVPEQRRPELIDKLIWIALDPNSGASARERVSAAKVLMAGCKLGLDAIRVSIAAEVHEDVLARLEALEAADDECDQQVDDPGAPAAPAPG